MCIASYKSVAFNSGILQVILMPEDDIIDRGNNIQLFEDKRIRTAWDEEKEEWYFSVVDVIAVLTNSENPQTYWRVMMNAVIFVSLGMDF